MIHRSLPAPAALVGVLALLATVSTTFADVYITEICASNRSVIRDEDGDFSDFIEVYNDDPSVSVNLDGWSVTDNPLLPRKWVAPAIVLPPRGFRLLWCSGKNRIAPAGEIHTNFSLESEGEFAGLYMPNGDPVAEIVFPTQPEDFSYGLSMNGASFQLVAENAPSRTLVPTNDALGTTWTQVGFNDASWDAGQLGVGYDRNSDYLPFIRTNVGADMDGSGTSCYIRIPFTLADAASVQRLTLQMRYDDGFVAYINGLRVASRNAPGSPNASSNASGQNDDSNAVGLEEVALAEATSAQIQAALRTGANVLAIHGLNVGSSSSDFLIQPVLDGGSCGNLDPDTIGFFPAATPGFCNSESFAGVAPPPEFSEPGSVFTGNKSLTLSTSHPQGVVRYTTNGSEPTELSTQFTGAINFSASTLVRAKVFVDGLASSATVSQGYIAISTAVRNFTSDLPIVIIENFGSNEPGTGSLQRAFLAIWEPEPGGRTSLTGLPVLETRIGIKRRGSSTAGQPKGQYAVEFWDEKDVDRDLSPLGMPAESDWVLYGGNSYDEAMIRNAFIFELSRRIDTYASRTEWCEVYFNRNGGTVDTSDTIGVYAFTEKIKRGADRVDVEKLTASIDSEPEVSGGYMFKIDRLDPGDSGFSAGGRTLGWVYPKEDFVTSQQRSWLSNHINTFISALNGGSFRDPVNGYQRYIDRDLWIDHHVLNVLAMNVDALRLSTYFYKARNGPIVAAPIWDFDRSMGSSDGRDDNMRSWNGTGDGTQFFTYPWWDRLFDDLDFHQLWVDRWQTQRRGGAFSNAAMTALVDDMASEINEAALRNHSRWGWGTFSSDISAMRSWLTIRADWIDSQLVAMPNLNSPSRQVSPGALISISGPGTIYYTLDGTDPRAPGGSPAPGASVYSGQISIDRNVMLVARSLSGAVRTGDGPRTNWSGPAIASYWTEVPRLVISEIMYHPLNPTQASVFGDEDFEFLEFQNASNAPLDLEGFQISGGIDFVFGPGAVLASGEYVVVVNNLEAFEERYNTAGIRIAGEYSGRLENLGEDLVVTGPLGEPVLDFEYDDIWYPETDGDGYSLVIVDPFQPLNLWGEQESWSPSSDIHGTPGEPDDVGSVDGRQLAGDSNQDGILDISDSVSLLRRLFVSGALTPPCDGATLEDGGNRFVFDVNDDGGVNVSDPLYILNYLFKNGPEPVGGTACVRVEGCPSVCF